MISDEPLQKVTLNLFRKDYLAMKRIHGDGYSIKIRDIVRKHLKDQRAKEMADDPV